MTQNEENNLQSMFGMENRTIEYSIIVPVYNEEESLKPLMSELLQALVPLNKGFEIIFVNDCSDDQTQQILVEFEKECPELVRNIHLEERSGQTFAMKKGLSEIKGNVAVTLDADLQNDPADIPKLIKKLEEGFDCVCGWRRNRKDKWLKARFSKLGNVLQRMFTGLSTHDVSCTLRAYKKHCVPKIDLSSEGRHRFIPLSLALQGYKIGEIESNHRLREYGTTKYSHKRLFAVVKDFFNVLKHKGKDPEEK